MGAIVDFYNLQPRQSQDAEGIAILTWKTPEKFWDLRETGPRFDQSKINKHLGFYSLNSFDKCGFDTLVIQLLWYIYGQEIMLGQDVWILAKFLFCVFIRLGS